MRNLAEECYHIRLKYSLNRQTLATLAGVSYNTIKHLENGGATTYETQKRIAATLALIEEIPSKVYDLVHAPKGKGYRY